MSSDKQTWFIRERSEALASLLLTARDGVIVRKESQRADGADLLIGIKNGEGIATKLFVVQVIGVLSSDPRQWAERVKPFFQGDVHYLPVCVLVTDVRENKAAYAWVAEPRVEGQAAKLFSHEFPDDFHPVDDKAVDQIVDRVREWYDMMPRGLASKSP